MQIYVGGPEREMKRFYRYLKTLHPGA